MQVSHSCQCFQNSGALLTKLFQFGILTLQGKDSVTFTMCVFKSVWYACELKYACAVKTTSFGRHAHKENNTRASYSIRISGFVINLKMKDRWWYLSLVCFLTVTEGKG
jgi:hypothetical protein